jgi:hypothetical protein
VEMAKAEQLNCFRERWLMENQTLVDFWPPSISSQRSFSIQSFSVSPSSYNIYIQHARIKLCHKS